MRGRAVARRHTKGAPRHGNSRRSRASTRHRCLLRPLRRQHHGQPLPDLCAVARTSAAVLQPALRLLGHLTARRHRKSAGGLADLRQQPKRHPGTDQVEIRHAARRDDVRRPAGAHHVARRDVAGVHPAPDGAARRPDSALLRSLPGSVGRPRQLRHHRRVGLDDADAGDRHAARHPQERPDRGSRRQRRQPAHPARHTDEGGQAGQDRRRQHLRRLHRLARQEPIRRPDDRVAQRRVRP